MIKMYYKQQTYIKKKNCEIRILRITQIIEMTKQKEKEILHLMFKKRIKIFIYVLMICSKKGVLISFPVFQTIRRFFVQVCYDTK